jgi:hypothetical protein
LSRLANPLRNNQHARKPYTELQTRAGCLGKREEMRKKWKKLLSEGLHNFCSSTNIIRMIISRRMRESAVHVGAVRNAYRISEENPERKKSFGRTDLKKKWEETQVPKSGYQH